MASLLDLVKHYQHNIEKYPKNADEQKVLRAIDKLFNLDVTVQHLQDTGVGRTVNALRKEPGMVGKAARALVYKWKLMVASEESDQEGDLNDSSTQNGIEKDSDDGQHSQSRAHKDQKQVNGNHSGSKRKYQSSEEEEPDTKKSRQPHTSDSDDYKKKHIQAKSEPESDSQTSDSHSESDSHSDESESPEEDWKQVKIKTEPEDKTSSSKHYSHSHSTHIKSESSSSKQSNEPSEHMGSKSSKYSSEPRHGSDKSSKSTHSSKEKISKDEKHSSNKKHSSDKNHKTDKQRFKEKEESKSSSQHSSDKLKTLQRDESSSDKHKSEERNKSDKHSKSDKQKDKISSEKEEYDKQKPKDSSSSKDRSSSNKEKIKHRSSSSKEKAKSGSSSHNKNENKQSSSNEKSDRSKSDNRSKTDKSEEKSSEKKTSHRSSSSKKSKSSSSKSNNETPKSVTLNTDSDDDGIGCESGASFAEALGMVVPAKSKKKPTTPIKDAFSPNNIANDLSPLSLLAPDARLAPLPALEISALPEISPHYKPRPPPKFMPHFTEEELGAAISSKNLRTKVYSGNKILGKIPSLYDMCVQVLQEHIDALEYTGGVPYEILKPVVDKATPQQLFMLEHYNPYLMDDTDHLWKKHCEKHFRNKKREEMETWREMFMRCQEEQESKLRSLTANIKLTQEAKKAPIKQTKMAYVDTVVKPPRNIARKQAVHGTAHMASASPAARVAALAAAPNVLRGDVRAPPAPAHAAHAHSRDKPKKAPLMAKALQLMRGRKR